MHPSRRHDGPLVAVYSSGNDRLDFGRESLMTIQSVELERRDQLRRDGKVPEFPVILPEATSRWPARQLWTPAYFAARVGHRRVTIDGSEYSIAELLELIDKSTPEHPAPYLRAQKLDEVLPELAADVAPPIDDTRPNRAESRLLPRSMKRHQRLEILLGGRGAGFHVLHYDVDHLHAFISQLYGTKRLFFFAPDQKERLYPRESAPNLSSVDIHNPDLDRFPRFAEAEMLTATLQPGETVFVPSGWWHTTKMEETSISVTWNFVEASNWDKFVADFRRKVTRRRHPAVGTAFAAYLAAYGMLAQAREKLARD
jgi:histone arginine demethylase JMJD6